MKKMRKTRAEKGITLIALIITIVVLLIIAVVAIEAIKESNIIGYASNAATAYNQAKVNEDSILLGYEDKIKDAIGGLSDNNNNSNNKYCNYTVKDLSSLEDLDALFGPFSGDTVPAVFMMGEDGTFYQCGRNL